MTTEERLEKIERELAAIKRGDVISAREFRVVDEKGKTRAVLGVSELGPGLGLFDKEGRAVWSAP